MRATVVSRDSKQGLIAAFVWALIPTACAGDQVIEVDRQRLVDLAAQPARQAELAQEINGRSKRAPIQIRRRSPSLTIEARSLSVVTAERVAYEVGARWTSSLPTSD